MNVLGAVVYVVDDDESIRSSVRNLLASVGLHVESFADAQGFLSADRRESAGCIILDVGLPGLNGLDLQSRLLDSDVAMPVIFITGRGDIPMARRC